MTAKTSVDVKRTSMLFYNFRLRKYFRVNENILLMR